MILKSFKYSTEQWSLDGLSLGLTNLIVGKNSSGKTRTLNALMCVKAVLAQRNDWENFENFNAELELTSSYGAKVEISLALADKKIVKEHFVVDGKEIILRDRNKSMIEGEAVSPPTNQLLMHVRRDTDKYPYIEEVITWADNTVIRSFLETQKPTPEQVYNIVSEFNNDMKKHVVEMVNKVGFPITVMDTWENFFKIDIKKLDPTNLEKMKFILFNEEGVSPFLFLEEMSNGMQRTILLFIFIEFLINIGYPALVAIDDLGEGLDYERATKVGKLLFDICENNNVQLIATSNEELMMNIVDINRWNILIRDGQKVKTITSASAPEVFEEFRFSGLDNFDFFTSDVFNRLR